MPAGSLAAESRHNQFGGAGSAGAGPASHQGTQETQQNVIKRTLKETVIFIIIGDIPWN